MKSSLWFIAACVLMAGCGKDATSSAASNTPSTPPKSTASNATPPTTTGTATPVAPGTPPASPAPGDTAKTGTTAPPASTSAPAGKTKPVAPAGPGTYALQVNAKVGQKFKYSFVTDNPMNGKKLTAGFTETCTKAEGGAFTLETTVDSFDFGVKLPPAQLEQIKKQKSTSTVHSDGTVDAAATPSMGGALLTIKFPDHAVKVGDTWDSSLNFSGQPKNLKAKLVKIDTHDGTKVAVVNLDIPKDPNDKMDVVGTPVVMISLADGLPVYFSLKMKADVPGSGGSKTSAVVLSRKS